MDSRGRGNDKGIKTNNIYLKTIVKETILLTIPSLKPLYNKAFRPYLK